MKHFRTYLVLTLLVVGSAFSLETPSHAQKQSDANVNGTIGCSPWPRTHGADLFGFIEYVLTFVGF